MALISLLLHLFVLLLLTVIVRRGAPPEALPPPAVAMVFETGATNGPSVPHPSETQELPKPAQPQPTPPEPPPPAPPAPVAPPTPPTPPAAAPEAAPPPPRTAEPTPKAEPAQETPAKETAPPVLTAPQAEAVVKPPAAQPAPRVEPVKPPAEAPRVEAHPLLEPVPKPVRPAPPRQASAPPRPAVRFPAPMKFSFGPTFNGNSTSLAEGPHRKGTFSVTPRADFSSSEQLGTDWRNELAAWLEMHKYYPQDAAMRGEQGLSTVRVVMNADGTVASVGLRSGSGYRALDDATVGLFRDARLPPLPFGSPDPTVTFDLTIHYMLVAR